MLKRVVLGILCLLFVIPVFAITVQVNTDQWQDWRWREHHSTDWQSWRRAHNDDWVKWREQHRDDYERWCFYHPTDC